MQTEEKENQMIERKESFVDIIKYKLKKLFGYKEGRTFIIDTEPYIKKYSEIELSEIANIEKELKKVLERNFEADGTIAGIDKDKALKLLEWVVQRDREILNIKSEEGIKNDSLLGCCGLSQGIVTELLTHMGLVPNILNVNPTIAKDVGRHAFNSVAIPIKENGDVHDVDFIIDATYRQFCLRDKYSPSGRFIKDKKFGDKVSPFAGYWCLKLPGGKEFLDKIIRNGYFELTTENAKLYGDSFTLEKIKDDEFSKKYEQGTTIPVSATKNVDTGISGEKYISQITENNKQEESEFDEGELKGYYGDLMKTPLMKKEETMIEYDIDSMGNFIPTNNRIKDDGERNV